MRVFKARAYTAYEDSRYYRDTLPHLQESSDKTMGFFGAL
jgi:hypothetical protein